MAAITTTKKTNFLNALVANATALKQTRDQLRLLAEEFAKDAAIGTIVDADCAASGSTQHLTAVIVANYLTAFQPGFEGVLAGTQVTPGAPFLPQVMAAIGS